MNSNTQNNNSDDEMNISTYKSVMDFSAKIGVPIAIGLTVMFTSLVLANGVFTSLFAGIVFAIATVFIVKSFFSH